MWDWSETQVKLVLLRHGETRSNQEHRYLGKTEENLSAAGEALLQDRKKFLPSVDYLFCSPMKRCVQTAQILYPNQEILRIPEWVEMDFGDFEGKNYVELNGNADYQKWIDSNGTLPFPNGESKAVFIERCKQGFYKMMQQVKCCKHSSDTLTVGGIVHGGTIMALLSAFAGGEYYDYQVANGQGYCCRLEEKDGKYQMKDVQKIEWNKERTKE